MDRLEAAKVVMANLSGSERLTALALVMFGNWCPKQDVASLPGKWSELARVSGVPAMTLGRGRQILERLRAFADGALAPISFIEQIRALYIHTLSTITKEDPLERELIRWFRSQYLDRVDAKYQGFVGDRIPSGELRAARWLLRRGEAKAREVIAWALRDRQKPTGQQRWMGWAVNTRSLASVQRNWAKLEQQCRDVNHPYRAEVEIESEESYAARLAAFRVQERARRAALAVQAAAEAPREATCTAT